MTEGAEDRSVGFVVKITPASSEAIETRFLISEFGYGASTTDDLAGIRTGDRFTIPAGVTQVTIPFHVVGDNVREGLEEFGLILRDVNPALATVHRSAMCTVRDDDTPGAWLTLPPSTARGSAATVTLTLNLAADADETFVISTTTPDLISVPASVMIRGGHKTATFDVSALGAGDAAIAVKLSKRLGNLEIPGSLFIYTLITPILPERVRVPVGTSVSMPVGLSAATEGAVHISAASDDRAIAGVEPLVAFAPNGGTIAIHGVAVGSTTISITLPAEFGGTTASIPVEVYVPPPGKTRAARH
ncbi:MAG TPA: hypothetical protein VEK79_07560 [Thermoanaerobaculia bacterium]|nr:hypothetical protein [Thermoanaerobaculia bacterium]